MNPSDCKALHDRLELYSEMSDLLGEIPEDAQEALQDPRLEAEPDLTELLTELRLIGQRFVSLAIKLQTQLDLDTWAYIASRFDVTRGDIIEATSPHHGTITIIVSSVQIWGYEDAEVVFGGPGVLTSGKPGKRCGAVFADQQEWKKVGHYSGELAVDARNLPFMFQRFERLKASLADSAQPDTSK